jgi:phytoene synthase
MPAGSEFDFPNPATPPGSAAYYVVRFAPAGQRNDLARLHAWQTELRHIVERARDPGVARLKLDWWRAELERAAAGAARHPLARALAGLLRKMPDHEPFEQMLDAAELDIRGIQPATDEELRQRLDRFGGAFAELSLHAGTAPGIDASRQTAKDPATRERARRFGTYEAAIRMLRDLYPSLRRNFCPLPLATMARFELHADRLDQAEQQQRLGRYSHELTRGLDVTAELYAEASRRRPELLPVRCSAALALALNRKLARRNYPLMRERVELSPIENLWTAWRLR